jgi:hypothetical protein
MTIQQKTAYKKQLQQLCIGMIEERIAANLALMNSAQEAANSESKSSAGDKYETSRAMNHLQKDMYASQLNANRLELAALLNINCGSIATTIGTGCFVKTKGMGFFIAAGLGKTTFENNTVFLLSPSAPVSRLLFTKTTGDSFLFNKELLEIEDFF